MTLEEELKLLSDVCGSHNCVEGFDCAYKMMKEDIMKRYNLPKHQFYAKLNQYNLNNENFGDVIIITLIQDWFCKSKETSN